MNAKDAIRNALKANHDILKMYLSDLSDADLLVRPVPNANHIAWQLGHLVSSEARFQTLVPGGTPVELPAGFDKQHNKETAAAESPAGFRTKQEYLELFDRVRGKTLAALDRVSDADLDKPTEGPMARLAPNLGALFFLMANHEMMHAGQFTVVRRKLGKPVLF
jgi:uncharacterized damage-inducible protein DinB